MNIDPLPERWLNGDPNAELGALIADPSPLESVEQKQLIQLLSQLDSLRAAVLVRLISPPLHPPAESASVDDDQLLTVAEVAVKLAVDERWVYEHTETDLKSCVRRIGSRTLRFSNKALERWLQSQFAGHPIGKIHRR